MKKQMTLLDLLTHNDHLKEGEQLILNDMMDYLIDNHCQPDSLEEMYLKDVDYYLTHPWVKVGTRENPEELQHLAWTKETGVQYLGETDNEIELIKKALLNYTLTINPKTPSRERWNIFADLIQEARKTQTAKENIADIQFNEHELAKQLSASSVFVVKKGRYRFFGLVEALGQVKGKQRYNLHVMDSKFNQPVVFYVGENSNRRFVKEPDSFQTFDLEEDECLVDFIQRLF